MIRNDMILLKLQGRTYQDIAELVGVTRQRIQQFLRPNLATRQIVRARANGYCERCGVLAKRGHIHHLPTTNYEFDNTANLEYLCLSCHRKQHPSPRVSLVCAVCGHTFNRRGSSVRRALKDAKYTTKQVFCSRECFGSYVGNHVGFKVHPENAGRGMTAHPLDCEICLRAPQRPQSHSARPH